MAFFLQLMWSVSPDLRLSGGGLAPPPEPTPTKYSVFGFLKVGSYVSSCVLPPSSFLSTSTVPLRVNFGFPLFLLPSVAQVTATFVLLYLSPKCGARPSPLSDFDVF